MNTESGVQESSATDGRSHWGALILLCLGLVAISIDSTVVVVALPSIKADLGFSSASLVGVVNAYGASYGGSLLLCGRLGDHFGYRRVFLLAIVVFTMASVGCALSTTKLALIVWRFVQGLAGASVETTAFSIIVTMFQDTSARARAMGVFGFVCGGGGIAGLLAGGLLTTKLNWHWIFLVNLPIGIAVYTIALVILPKDPKVLSRVPLDLAGAGTITASMIVAIFAIQGVDASGWRSAMTLSLFIGAVALFVIFLQIESRVQAPLVPLPMFRLHNLLIASVASGLSSVVGSATIFIAQYMQFVLKCNPLEVGLAFVPSSLVMAIFSLGLSGRLVIRFGFKWPLVLGLLLSSFGLILLTQASVDGTVLSNVIPGLTLVGLGIGIGCNPMLVAAMSEVPPGDIGVATGIIATSTMFGNALGIAVLASTSAIYTQRLHASGVPSIAAVNGSYHIVFLLSAILNAVAVPVVLRLRRISRSPAETL